MSLASVRSGTTNPNEVRKLLRRGVEVYSRGSLHAKFFIIGRQVIAGSSNVSKHAKEVLDEAAIVTDDAATVRRANQIFAQLCTEPGRRLVFPNALIAVVFAQMPTLPSATRRRSCSISSAAKLNTTCCSWRCRRTQTWSAGPRFTSTCRSRLLRSGALGPEPDRSRASPKRMHCSVSGTCAAGFNARSDRRRQPWPRRRTVDHMSHTRYRRRSSAAGRRTTAGSRKSRSRGAYLHRVSLQAPARLPLPGHSTGAPGGR